MGVFWNVVRWIRRAGGYMGSSWRMSGWFIWGFQGSSGGSVGGRFSMGKWPGSPKTPHTNTVGCADRVSDEGYFGPRRV